MRHFNFQPQHLPRISVLTFAALLVTTICLSSCSPVVDQAAKEREQDASIATVQWLEGKFGFVDDRDVRQLMERVTNRLSSVIFAAANAYRFSETAVEQNAGYQWQTFVLNSDSANAFAIGAGTLVVTKGLLAKLTNEAELAAVMSHEIAHQVLGHTSAAIRANGLSPDSPRFALSYEHEVAADEFGVMIMRYAGYNMRGAPNALNILYRPTAEEIAEGSKDNWLAERSARLQMLITRQSSGLPSVTTTREFNRVRARLKSATETS